MSDQSRYRHWDQLKYARPKDWLLALAEIEQKTADVEMDWKVRTLRKASQKKWRESRQAALLLYGISQQFDIDLIFAVDEMEDFDCIATWIKNDEKLYAPIQLKEIVPEYLNSSQDLQKETDKIKTKYSSETIVGFHLNREFSFTPKELNFDGFIASEVWLFGSTTNDKKNWMLIGDMLTNPQISEFVYPD